MAQNENAPLKFVAHRRRVNFDPDVVKVELGDGGFADVERESFYQAANIMVAFNCPTCKGTGKTKHPLGSVRRMLKGFPGEQLDVFGPYLVSPEPVTKGRRIR